MGKTYRSLNMYSHYSADFIPPGVVAKDTKVIHSKVIHFSFKGI